MQTLKLKAVCDRFHVHPATVWRWVQKGVLPQPLKIGGSVYWLADELDAVIAKAGEARR
jgi:predicted DNA-binding transcriptional regulator AlpA